ncbi:hypothetical protein Fmac_032744 [Flemingia macrophylla]|uniref:Uncharacterized protein n=1 Tax=Flemingia macrophylla TaxID=520843 RepID=A0ABD1L5S5_9FABA
MICSFCSRLRDRFRKRENGRSGSEGITRAGQLPTILQSRDRQDDTGSMYEENADGRKDSADTSSIGDPELVSTFDGQPGGYGSQRHSSRGSKSRQLEERRDRDSRREGKWERKHS